MRYTLSFAQREKFIGRYCGKGRSASAGGVSCVCGRGLDAARAAQCPKCPVPRIWDIPSGRTAHRRCRREMLRERLVGAGVDGSFDAKRVEQIPQPAQQRRQL